MPRTWSTTRRLHLTRPMSHTKSMHKRKHYSLAEVEVFIAIREMMPTVPLETVVKMVKGQFPDVFGRLKGYVADWFAVTAEEQRMKNEDEAEATNAQKDEERVDNKARSKHKAATPLDEQEARVTKKLKRAGGSGYLCCCHTARHDGDAAL